MNEPVRLTSLIPASNSVRQGRLTRRLLRIISYLYFLVEVSFAQTASQTTIFAPVSTPAQSIFDLSRLVLMITGAIFVVVFALLAYAVVKFRKRSASDGREPAHVYGSTQVELAWTVSRSSLFWSCSSRRHA